MVDDTANLAEVRAILPRRELAVAAFTAGFFLGMLGVMWYAVLVEINPTVTSATFGTIGIAGLYAIQLYRSVRRTSGGEA